MINFSVEMYVIITIDNGQPWSIEFQTRRGCFDTRKESLRTRRDEAKCF